MKTLIVPVRSRWTLLLSAYLTLTARADCGEDCAYCSQQLPLQVIKIHSIECVVECEEHLNAGSSWSLCKRFMLNADNTPEGNRASTEMEHLDTHQHPVDKKYGGFMKRYGGFMKRYGGFMKRYGGFMKKTAELYGLEPEDVDHGRAILTNHDVEMLANQVESDGEREEAALTDVLDSKGEAQSVKGMAKRYGGFMKRGELYELYESGVKALQKRYGGFMRRVGRPQWWQESKRYGGFLKRSQDEDEDENSSEIEKRYGGFMGY
ncbi:proenkephalin b [Carassius carassius]|uniref:proenkephalin b n=1 Tax=Carassius carassius TaxID=217509 RepID=UPI00286965C8|nr:proenkephalin b [Carassius carassius]